MTACPLQECYLAVPVTGLGVASAAWTIDVAERDGVADSSHRLLCIGTSAASAIATTKARRSLIVFLFSSSSKPRQLYNIT